MATLLARSRTLPANPLRILTAVRARAAAGARAREIWPAVRAAADAAAVPFDGAELGEVVGDASVGLATVRSVAGGRWILRFAARPEAVDGLARADAALAQVRSAGPALARLVPEVVLGGTAGPVAWRLETFLDGRPATAFVGGPDMRPVLIGRIGAALATVRAAVADARPLTRSEVAEWLERDRAAAAVPGIAEARLDAVADALDGVTTPVGLIHGDLWAGNVLLDPIALDVSGIVDWDSASTGEPAFHDVLHLLLTARRRADRAALGRVVARALDRPEWEPWESRLLEEVGLAEAGRSPDGSRTVVRAAVVAYWLRQIGSNLARHPVLGSDRGWVRDNVAEVARWV